MRTLLWPWLGQVSNVTPALAWQVCVFCKFKFCIEHAHARKHGCDEAIAKAGREKYGSGGGGTFGAGRPTRTGDELQRSLAARLDASEQGRKKKATSKKKKKKKR